MAMSRKHYDAIALTFKPKVTCAREHAAEGTLSLLIDLAVDQARVLMRDNGNFNCARFFAACGFNYHDSVRLVTLVTGNKGDKT